MSATVRIVHDFGGPTRDCPIERRGSVLLLSFGELSGWYQVDLITGRVKGIRGKTLRWTIHPDDFKYLKQDDRQKKKRRF